MTIAEVFGKDHDKVIRDIKNPDCSEEFSRLNFEPSNYINERGRTYPKYYITQDGFSFLVMGYTGKLAAQYKESYIRDFNRMRDKLQLENVAK
ncbi:Rha family transcriptional regulator [Paenibacillus sp. FSL L8-0506]|uniref:Rha family transcriptional regulator n=1 Tax=Paenibacillus sp. FSL L8-0506 TaxID=2975335 RepID=UPI0030F51CD5